MRSDELSIRDHGPVRVIALNRPAQRNAVDGVLARALYDAFTEFDGDRNAKVAILTGEGGTFCAGVDLKALSGGDNANPIKEGGPGSLAPMGATRMQLDKPVIAAIEGHAVAGGLELALWCDLRVMAETAVMGVYCRRFGVPLIDMGTVRLPRLIGGSRAMDLILTGRSVAAEEAYAMGLANRLAPPGKALETALALADDLAAFPQQCLRNDRRSAIEQWGLSPEAAMANEFRLGLATIKSGETVRGAAKFAEGAGRHGRFGDD